jgi:hypothetical protein
MKSIEITNIITTDPSKLSVKATLTTGKAFKGVETVATP